LHVGDVVWSYSGVRPLYDDGATEAQEATRDYVLRVDNDGENLPLINIFGGKITTYRKLSESMLTKIEGLIGAKGDAWTANSSLPGGDFKVNEFNELVQNLKNEYDFLEISLAERFIRSYGTNAWILMDGIAKESDMGQEFGCSLFECEVNYLINYEWAECADDIVWRRTKLGIKFSEEDKSILENWMSDKVLMKNNKNRGESCCN